jgi:ATP-dependent DNA helicase RecG
MSNTTDGFQTAEEDLRLRGEGDIAGIQQSGQIEFKLANLGEDLLLFERVRKEAEEIVACELSLTEHELLTIFGY